MIVCQRHVRKSRAQKLMPNASSSQGMSTDSRMRQTSCRFALRRKSHTRKTVRAKIRVSWTGRRFKNAVLYHEHAVILRREDAEGPVGYGSFAAPSTLLRVASNDIEDVVALTAACDESNPQRRLGPLAQPA